MSCEDFIYHKINLENDLGILEKDVYMRDFIIKMVPSRLEPNSPMVEHDMIDIDVAFIKDHLDKLVADAKDCQAKDMSIPLNIELERQHAINDIGWLRRLYPQYHDFTNEAQINKLYDDIKKNKR
jgi:hypothetical protein